LDRSADDLGPRAPGSGWPAHRALYRLRALGLCLSLIFMALLATACPVEVMRQPEPAEPAEPVEPIPPEAVAEGCPGGVTFPDPPAEIAGVEDEIFELTNGERADAGAPPLERDPTLRGIARRFSEEMLERGFFGHVNPEGESMADRVARQHRCLVGILGENLWQASGFTHREGLAAQAVAGWMNSPGHRENLLRPEFTHLGVGVALVGREVRATQVFAGVQGFAAEAVPQEISRGDTISIRVRPIAGVRSPSQFDLWAPQRQQRAAGPLALTSPVRIDAPPGEYRMRVYFPVGGMRYQIVQGPAIHVR
jgi:uncharacterized protein YkwD